MSEHVVKKHTKNALRGYVVLAALVVAGLAAYFGFGALFGNQESTDNAQIDADVLPVAARISAPVLKIHVVDNQKVKAGDLLIELDPTDASVREKQAEADYEAALVQAERAPTKANSGATAQVLAARAALAQVKASLSKAQDDFRRARELKKQDAISQEELENFENTYQKSQAAVDQFSAQLRLAQSQNGVSMAKVKAAEATLAQAKNQLSYTKITAAHDGTLSKLGVKEGQLIQAGQLLVQIVSSTPYIIANFKETQVGRMTPAQRVEIKVDALPRHVFSGSVESISPATGARFSVIPPDNATGNFVKVVQRVPVKIRFDSGEGLDLLRAGLSAETTVYFK